MGKNKLGGKNFKKQKKVTFTDRELIFKDDKQFYSRIVKLLGDGRFVCQIFNSSSDENLIGKICGSMRKKSWINIGDIVLVSMRDFDPSCCDIIHKYTSDETKNLKNWGELPANLNLQATKFEIENGKLANDTDELELSFI